MDRNMARIVAVRSSAKHSGSASLILTQPVLWAATILTPAAGLAQQAAAPLVIASESLPAPLVHQRYETHLEARGGVPPLHWSTSRGHLPEGLTLDPPSGMISGVPTVTGEFDLTLTVVDSVGDTSSRDYKLKLVAPLLLEWLSFPRIQGDQILGSVKVSNGTKDLFDLTVIVLAVNEHGKAFALGYQHFDLQAETMNVEIPFGSGSNLPVGSYTVHADAVAEVGSKDTIFRSRQQTSLPLDILPPP